jgi:hypothetical protein
LHPPLMYFAPTGQVVLRGRSRGVTPPAGVFCPYRAGRAAGPLTRGCTPHWGILPLHGRACCGAAHVGLHPPLGYFTPAGQVILRGRSRGVAPPADVFCPYRAGRAAGPLTRGYTPRWGILPLQGRSFCGATHEGLHPPLMYFAPTGRGVLRGYSRGVAPPAGVFCPCRAGHSAGPRSRGCTPR